MRNLENELYLKVLELMSKHIKECGVSIQTAAAKFQSVVEKTIPKDTPRDKKTGFLKALDKAVYKAMKKLDENLP